MKKIMKYITVIFGLLLMAISFNLFQEPFNFAAGGVTGLSIILHKFINIDESVFIFIINQSLIIVSFLVLGKKKTINTILGSILLPILIKMTSFLSSIITLELDYILIAIIGGVLYGVGLGLIYKNGFTSGGTDILNQIMEVKYKMPIDKSIITVDGFIVVLSAIAFGIPSMIYSFIMLIIISYISNKTILELNQNKVLYIYTDEANKIKEYLTKSFNYDLTIFNTIGGFSKKRKHLYMCSVSTKDYYAIKEGILYIDLKAFIVVTNAYEQKNANVLIRQNNS